MKPWEYTMIIKAQEELKPWRSRRKEKKTCEKRAKKQAKSGVIEKDEKDNTIPLDTVITLDHLTNPDKK